MFGLRALSNCRQPPVFRSEGKRAMRPTRLTLARKNATGCAYRLGSSRAHPLLLAADDCSRRLLLSTYLPLALSLCVARVSFRIFLIFDTPLCLTLLLFLLQLAPGHYFVFEIPRPPCRARSNRKEMRQ
ncbi:hypothetical protein HDK64DRAFT_33082 [Phyllosticta capitalensis]